MAANAIDQTRRMLSLVTYLRERPGAHVADVARAFGITEDELISDLDVLPMCGTSFRGGDLLDIDTDGERIWWRNPDASGESTAEPLRLAADEATALLVAARAVATLPGLRESDRDALLRATAKLEAAAGEVAGASSRLSVTFESEGGVFADVDRAIAERRRVWLRYYSPARDELTERTVDPIRLFAVGHTYMEVVPPLGGPAHLPARPGRRDPAAGRAGGAAGDRAARPVRGSRTARGGGSRGRDRGGARWPLGRRVLPARQRGGAGGRGLRITLRTPDPASLRRLGLRLGGDGRIVSPAAVSDSARRAAREALAGYGEEV